MPPQRSLALAGAQMSRTPLASGGKPMSTSMHESCLRERWQRKEPAMTSIEALKASLAEDALRQARKYRGSTPRADNARFNVELPRSPQNMKFSTMNRSRMEALGSADFSVASRGLGVEGEADMEGSPGETPRAHPIHRFNVNTLRDWFFNIDTDRSGSITQRELIVALRQHKGMQALFCQISGVENGEIKMISHTNNQDRLTTTHLT